MQSATKPEARRSEQEGRHGAVHRVEAETGEANGNDGVSFDPVYGNVLEMGGRHTVPPAA